MIITNPIKEPARLPKNPAPFGQFDFTLLQGLIAVVQGSDSLFEAFASLSQLINF